MNITFLHDLDTGFLASTLKPALQSLGHTVTVLQTLVTYLEEPQHHIDYLLKDHNPDMENELKTVFSETDYFILRSISDYTLHTIKVLPYINQHNTIFKVHGSELREKNVPYSLRTWRTNWHNKEPILLAPRDPSLLPLYHKNTYTHIERPCNFSIFPRKNTNTEQPFAITTPTNIQRKGTQSLIDNWKSKIPLHIAHGVSRIQALKHKAQASFYIDNIGSYAHGPYGMNSVEAWFYQIPVFSNYSNLDLALVPRLHEYIIHSTQDTIQSNIDSYTSNKSALKHAKHYAFHTHNPTTIAQQYIHTLSSL